MHCSTKLSVTVHYFHNFTSKTFSACPVELSSWASDFFIEGHHLSKILLGANRVKTPESSIGNDTNNVDDRADVNIDEPMAQEIEKQSDTDLNKSADSGSDGEDGHVGTHSPPLAQRRSARQRELPAKYDGFIIVPLKQLSAILENKFLGQVYTEHSAQMCV